MFEKWNFGIHMSKKDYEMRISFVLYEAHRKHVNVN
jgi:hypothetical protein